MCQLTWCSLTTLKSIVVFGRVFCMVFPMFLYMYQGSSRNKISVKVGNLAQGGGGSDPIPTFINHCFYGIFDPFSEKFTEKIPMYRERGGVKPVGPNPQLLPKICFESSPYIIFQSVISIYRGLYSSNTTNITHGKCSFENNVSQSWPICDVIKGENY